jgi:hypothetical protein
MPRFARRALTSINEKGSIMSIRGYKVNIGSNLFTETPCAIAYETSKGNIIPFLRANIRHNDFKLQFSFTAFDDKNNKIHVKHNIPVGVNKDFYEISHQADRKVLTSKLTGKIILEIVTKGIKSIEIYGDFYIEGAHFEITRDLLKITTKSGAIGNFHDCKFFSQRGIIINHKSGFSIGGNKKIEDSTDL